MWTVTKSDWRSSSSLLTSVAPAACAFSAVRFWLQAITFMSIALAMRATRVPSLPSPMMPSVLP